MSNEPAMPPERPADDRAVDACLVGDAVGAAAASADAAGADADADVGADANANANANVNANANANVDVDPDAGDFMTLPPLSRTLPGMLQRQAERFGARPLLQIGDVHWSHRDAAGAAGRAGAALRQAGIGRGDRVALMIGNRAEFLEVLLGCGWIGAVAVPVNTASMGPQIGYYLADSGARLLVIEAGFAERLAAAALERSVLESIWVVGADGRRFIPPLVDKPSQPYSAAGIAPIEAAEGVLPGDPLAILYTSGTTGPAKGVACPHAQFFYWGANTVRILGIGSADVLCTTLPLFHVNALNTFFQAALAGCRVVYEARFSASGFWPAMQASMASVIYLLGAMVPILLAQPEAPAERAHRVRLGLGPGVPAAAGRAFEARTGVPLLEGYGSTETNFAIAGRLDALHTGTMGWLQPGFDARVVDEQTIQSNVYDPPVSQVASIAGKLTMRSLRFHWVCNAPPSSTN